MTQQLQNYQYDVFSAVRTRVSHNGIAVMPVAGPSPQPAVVVSLNGGLEYDWILCCAATMGRPPYVPAPIMPHNNNRIFLQGGQSGVFPIPELGGAKAYGVLVWYKFGILTPEGLQSDFMLGNLPFPGLDQDERIPGGYFTYNLVNNRMTRALPGSSELINALPQLLRQIVQRGG